MYEVSVTCQFITRTEEQAELIRQFFDDAQSLMSCETSVFSSTEVTQTDRVSPLPLMRV